MSNYPPGVTGNEIQISGPTDEGTDVFACPQCQYEGKMDWYSHHDTGIMVYCPECKEEFEHCIEDPFDDWDFVNDD